MQKDTSAGIGVPGQAPAAASADPVDKTQTGGWHGWRLRRPAPRAKAIMLVVEDSNTEGPAWQSFLNLLLRNMFNEPRFDDIDPNLAA